jgi:hypothetical protein
LVREAGQQHRRGNTAAFLCTPVVGKRAVGGLIDDWDLDLNDLYWRQPYLMPVRRMPPKLVHKVLFSMPAGTTARQTSGSGAQFRPAGIC